MPSLELKSTLEAFPRSFRPYRHAPSTRASELTTSWLARSFPRIGLGMCARCSSAQASSSCRSTSCRGRSRPCTQYSPKICAAALCGLSGLLSGRGALQNRCRSAHELCGCAWLRDEGQPEPHEIARPPSPSTTRDAHAELPSRLAFDPPLAFYSRHNKSSVQKREEDAQNL